MFQAMLAGRGLSVTALGPSSPTEGAPPRAMFAVTRPRNARQAEVIAEHLDAGRSDVADEPLHALHLEVPARTVEQDVGPQGRIEILDRVEGQPMFRHGVADGDEFDDLPHAPFGDAPSRSVADGLISASGLVVASEVVAHVHDDVGRPALPGEREMRVVQHVAVEPQSRVSWTRILRCLGVWPESNNAICWTNGCQSFRKR